MAMFSSIWVPRWQRPVTSITLSTAPCNTMLGNCTQLAQFDAALKPQNRMKKPVFGTIFDVSVPACCQAPPPVNRECFLSQVKSIIISKVNLHIDKPYCNLTQMYLYLVVNKTSSTQVMLSSYRRHAARSGVP